MCFLPLFSIVGASCFKSCLDTCKPCAECMDSCCSSISDKIAQCEIRCTNCQRKYCMSAKAKQQESLERKARVAKIRELKNNQSSVAEVKSKFQQFFN